MEKKKGYEYLDPVPKSASLGFKKPPTLQEMIKQMVQSENWRRAMDQQGMETFEEAEDFEVDDEELPIKSPWELQYDPETRKEMLPAEKAFLDKHRSNFDKFIGEERKKKVSQQREEGSPPRQNKKGMRATQPQEDLTDDE